MCDEFGLEGPTLKEAVKTGRSYRAPHKYFILHRAPNPIKIVPTPDPI